MNISLLFRLDDTLPTVEEQLTDLWKAALLLERMGLPLDQWHPPADTPENSLKNLAFDSSGPTAAAIAILKAQQQDKELPGARMFGVWNGTEKDGAVAFESSLSILKGASTCTFSLQSRRVPALTVKEAVIALIKGLTEIWPALVVEVAPYKYSSTQQVFPDRPGAGWMLYLAKTILASDIPEAMEVIPALNAEGHQCGTILVSVSDESFSSENVDHVKRANDMEIRLVDRDLLPRYRDL